MVWTNPKKTQKPVTCAVCYLTTVEYNRQHFGKDWRHVCLQCHAELNYYLAKCEENTHSWTSVETAKALIDYRKRVYGPIPPPKRQAKKNAQLNPSSSDKVT